MSRTELIVAVLIGAVIAGAWYAGLSTDFATFMGGLNRFAMTLQGRNQQGNFPGYPGNAPNVAAVGFQS